jgi:hypothetical protein
LVQWLGQDQESKPPHPRRKYSDCFVRILGDFHVDNIPLLSTSLNSSLSEVYNEIIMLAHKNNIPFVYVSQWTFPLITKILISTKISSQLERASQN